MISSCSPWMVPTMSPRRPVRPSSSAATSVRSPLSPVRSPPSPVKYSSSMPKQFAVPGYVVAAAAEPHGLAAGGAVERFCDRRPPVDDHRVAVLVEDGDAADMEMVTLGLVDTPEDQRLVADIQVFEPGSHLVGEDVSFVAGLVGAALARFDIVGDGLFAASRDWSRRA